MKRNPEMPFVHKQLFLLRALTIVALLALVGALTTVFGYAPLEKSMGAVQKVFYVHVSAAWVGLLGFLLAAFAGSFYLATRKRIWDHMEVAAVEISLVFFFIAIALGSIWARPTWGVWWVWEPRLTTAAIVALLYLAYFLLRRSVIDAQLRARFGAVYVLLSALSVPLTFFSIRLFRTLHPLLFGAKSSPANGVLTPPMLVTLVANLVAFSILFPVLLWHRLRLGLLAEEVERLEQAQTE